MLFASIRPALVEIILSLAGDATPMEPPALVEEYRRVAAETLAVYEGRPG